MSRAEVERLMLKVRTKDMCGGDKSFVLRPSLHMQFPVCRDTVSLVYRNILQQLAWTRNAVYIDPKPCICNLASPHVRVAERTGLSGGRFRSAITRLGRSADSSSSSNVFPAMQMREPPRPDISISVSRCMISNKHDDWSHTAVPSPARTACSNEQLPIFGRRSYVRCWVVKSIGERTRTRYGRELFLSVSPTGMQ
jgi:hypothetical protein